VKRIFVALIAAIGTAVIITGAQAQQPGYPLPQPVPLPARTLENCNKQAPKMSVTRATFDRVRRTTSILAPISTLASGLAEVQLLGGRRITEFNVRIDSSRGLIRATRGIDEAQARASTALLTIRYPGDSDTRPQSLRLRAGLRASRLSSKRPTISPAGQLDVAGAITRRAKGVVRVTLEWVNGADGSITVVERLATIRAPGRWGVRSQLPQGFRDQIAARCSTVQAHVLFTGVRALNMRGEMRAFQVMPKPLP